MQNDQRTATRNSQKGATSIELAAHSISRHCQPLALGKLLLKNPGIYIAGQLTSPAAAATPCLTSLRQNRLHSHSRRSRSHHCHHHRQRSLRHREATLQHRRAERSLCSHTP